MKYDDASWHDEGGSFPSNSPMEYSGTHIALFLKYCFLKGWAGEFCLEGEPVNTQKVIDGQLSATDFLFNYCDGKLLEVMFNETGNAFAEKYYGDDGLYFDDYMHHFGKLMYKISEEDFDFNKYYEVLNSRFKSGILTNSQIRKSKWKFWKINK